MLIKLNNKKELIKNERDIYTFSSIILTVLSLIIYLVFQGPILTYFLFLIVVYSSNIIKFIRKTYYKREELKLIDIDNLEMEINMLKLNLENLAKAKELSETNKLLKEEVLVPDNDVKYEYIKKKVLK